jgi:hypothetical protein
MRAGISWIGSLALTLLGAACATVPTTGRTQLNMISAQQLTLAANQNFAKFMGLVTGRAIGPLANDGFNTLTRPPASRCIDRS